MEEAKADGAVAVSGGDGGGVSEPSSRVTSSFKMVGDRQVFSVELRPGETTIVSWKKLMKDANKAGDDNKPLASSAGGPSSAATAAVAASAFDLRIASGQPGEHEIKDAAPVNSFSTVIEKIERLYMGKDSSGEEDPNEVPDDDQYDTEDSFIDDTELDEYFEVDHASIRYDGFFVNRGKLECISKPNAPPSEQPKKRRRKDLQNGASERGEGFVPNKHAKVRKVGTVKAPSVSKPSSQNGGASSEPREDMRLQNHYTMPASDIKKKSGEATMTSETASLAKVANGVLSTCASENKDTEKQCMNALQFKNLSGNVKDLSGSSDVLHNRLHEKVASAQHSGRSLNQSEECQASKRTKEKGSVREVPDLNMPDGRHASETYKPSNSHRKDGSGVRPKSSSLEKAIRDLEKLVAESKPPVTENLDVDLASQANKRRLPSDVKLKLARVARLAQSNHGKISKELITRLMSILGDSVQLRTLQRHLKVMVSTGISAKQEKENRFQQIKKEVLDMIRMCIPTMELKVQEHHAGSSDDFQDFNTEVRGIPKRKYEMDTAMEDKICDLYDLYVDSLDEDTGPQVRKLYSELAELWPNGLMDNHGVKRAICRAKERRRALFGKHKDDQEKMKQKKALLHRTEEAAKFEGTSPIHPQQGRDKSVVDSSIPSSTMSMKPTSMGPTRVPSPSTNVVSERPKHEKAKISYSSRLETSLRKKKIRRKPEVDLNEMPFHSEKVTVNQVEERVASYNQSLSLQPAAAPSFKQSS